MSDQHNPIAQLVTIMQRDWQKTASENPDAQFIRWLIKKEESRLFEGFSKLESSPHGSLEDVFVTMFTPFNGEEDFSIQLVRDWIKAFEEDKQVEDKSIWDFETFSTKEKNCKYEEDKDLLLVELLDNFRQNCVGDRPLVLNLLPRNINSPRSLNNWLEKIANIQLPEKVKISVLDYQSNLYLKRFFNSKKNEKFKATIVTKLDYDGAVNKLITAGAASDPQVEFRKCMLEMGKAAGKKDEALLDKWGQRAIEAGQRSGDKALFATAHMFYAANLFGFKKDEKITKVFDQTNRIIKKGIQSENPAFTSLNIQLHGFMASNHKQFGRKKKAIEYFEKQGNLCLEHNFVLQSIMPFTMVLEGIKSDNERYNALLEKVYIAGDQLSKEELESSTYCYIAQDYHTLLLKQSKYEEAETLDQRFSEIFGESWKEDIQKRRKQVKKKIKLEV